MPQNQRRSKPAAACPECRALALRVEALELWKRRVAVALNRAAWIASGLLVRYCLP